MKDANDKLFKKLESSLKKGKEEREEVRDGGKKEEEEKREGRGGYEVLISFRRYCPHHRGNWSHD